MEAKNLRILDSSFSFTLKYNPRTSSISSVLNDSVSHSFSLLLSWSKPCLSLTWNPNKWILTCFFLSFKSEPTKVCCHIAAKMSLWNVNQVTYGTWIRSQLSVIDTEYLLNEEWMNDVSMLKARLVHFFCKGLESKYFHFCYLYGLCWNYSFLPLWYKSTHRQCIKWMSMVCSNKTSYTKIGGGVPCQPLL